MYKKTITFLLLAFSINMAICQDKIKLLLDYTMTHVVDTTQRTKPRITRCLLIAGSAMSMYDDYYRSLRFLGYKGNEAIRVYNSQLEINEAAAGISCDQVFTNFEKKELITGSYFWKVLYAKVEPLSKIDWKIHPQKKKILEQDCQKATAFFGGREYTAWFAPAIPLNAGPWKLNGLPGVILAANDEKNEIAFICTKITLPEESLPALEPSQNAKLLSSTEFNKSKQKFAEDPQAFYDPTDPFGSIMAFSTPPGFKQEPKENAKPRPLNNPIEKE